MDVQGEVRLAKNVLTDLLAQATKTQVAAQALPFHIKGNLDSPNVKLDTSSLSAAGRGLAIPGIDKLFKKKGIGNILQKIIPGAQTAPQTAPSSSQNEPPPPPTEEKKVRPEDILRGLFKKLR